MSDLVTIDVRDHVADVRLNRPEKMNAVNAAMWSAITEAGESLHDRDDVRAVVLSGNGRGFCAGLDMESFAQMAGGSDEPPATNESAQEKASRIKETLFQRAALVWKRLPVPVIAAIHGPALGAGAQIALGADIRIVAPDIRFSILEIKWGLVPDVGITQTLRNVVPLDIAKELTFTGRMLDGETAKAYGLATHVSDDPLKHAFELANEIAGKSPDAVRFGKHLLETTWNAAEDEGLELEFWLQRNLIGKPNQTEAIKANFEKRAPDFEAPQSIPPLAEKS